MQLEKDPYYEVGSIDDIVLSQSLLAQIDPKRGGSPRKFQDYLINRLDQPSKAMLRGSVFHLYAENKKAFAISDAVKPADKLGLVADAVVAKYDAADHQTRQEMLMMIDQHVLQACRDLSWNKTWGDAAIIKNTTEVGIYLNAVYDPANEGKIILTAVLKEQIEKCIASLSSNDYAHRLLFWKDEFSNIEYFKEIDIYWTEVIDGEEMKFKAKLDDLIINHETREVDINDLKTHGGSAYNFEGAFKAYRLDIQFATYTRAVIAKFPGVIGYRFNYRHVVVETSGLFLTVVHRWHKDIIGAAQHDLDNLIRRVISAKKNKFRLSIEEIQGGGEIRHKELEA